MVDAGTVKQEEGQVEDIWRLVLCVVERRGERGREKGVGSIPAIRCKTGKVVKRRAAK